MPLDSSTSIIISGIQCWDEGTEEHFQRFGHSTAVRNILCAWGDRLTLVNALRGGAGINNGVYYYNLSADYPDAAFLAFDSVTITGIAGESGLSVGPNGQVAYKYARLAIVYKTLDYLEGTTTGTLSLDYSTEVIAAPQTAAAFVWADGSDVDPADCPAIRVPIVTLVQTRKNLAALPTVLVQSLSGCINSAAFLGGAVGTVLFDGAHATRRLTTTGAENWDMTYKFLYCRTGWNYFLRAGEGFVAVNGKGTGTPPYASADLVQLLE